MVRKWIAVKIEGEYILIKSTGEAKVGCCCMENQVQDTLLNVTKANEVPISQVYNEALDDRVTPKQLYSLLCDNLRCHIGTYMYDDLEACGDTKAESEDAW